MEISERFQRIEGGYPMFAKGRANCSIGKYQKLKKKFFEELERYNNPEHHDRSGLPFEEWTYVKGLNYIIQQAEEYLEIKEAEAKALKEQNSKLEEQRNFTLTNKSWILFFYNQPNRRHSLKPILSVVSLNCLEDFKCQLESCDELSSSLLNTIEGSYRWITDRLYSFYFPYDKNKILMSIFLYFSDDYNDVVGIYMRTQSDNLFSGRIRGRFLGSYLNKRDNQDKLDSTISRLKETGEYDVIIDEVGNKSGNFLSFSVDSQIDYLKLYRNIGIGSMDNGYRLVNFQYRYVDHEEKEIYVNTDTIINSLSKQNDLRKRNDLINLRSLVEAIKMDFYESRAPRIKTIEDLLKKRLRIYTFIHIHTGTQESTLHLILLGRSLELCRRVLIICNEKEKKSFEYFASLNQSQFDNLQDRASIVYYRNLMDDFENILSAIKKYTNGDKLIFTTV
ncbi:MULTISPECIES: hypothetical protein [Roseivirga]|nr:MULTISPECIES: hypothetical protein [Roseivirga]MBO6662694.1 hypothetical protein [Roseivirga sp.]MBO6909701.1 hypothetical protein [Roseivirga sp.]WPZ10922.1 hypothetical protein T7867_02275 [Roseivirga spongicola]